MKYEMSIGGEGTQEVISTRKAKTTRGKKGAKATVPDVVVGDLIEPEVFDRSIYDEDVNFWAFDCDGVIVEGYVAGKTVYLSSGPATAEVAEALKYAQVHFGDIEFMGVQQADGRLSIAMLTQYKGTDMAHHVASVRVNPAAGIGLFLREDGYEAVSFLPCLKTAEEKMACEHPVYYHQSAAYGLFHRLALVPEVPGEDEPSDGEW